MASESTGSMAISTFDPAVSLQMRFSAFTERVQASLLQFCG